MNPHSKADLILYQFSRPMIEAGDFKPFLERFALEHLPEGQALRRYCNRFSFAFRGYDSDEREIYEIPEIRAFVQAFRRAWPFWFFGCHLDFPDLQALTFCCLPSLEVRRKRRASPLQVMFEASELGAFLSENFDAMNLLCDRARMTEAENRERSRQIVEYYARDWSDYANSLSTKR